MTWDRKHGPVPVGQEEGGKMKGERCYAKVRACSSYLGVAAGVGMLGEGPGGMAVAPVPRRSDGFHGTSPLRLRRLEVPGCYPQSETWSEDTFELLIK